MRKHLVRHPPVGLVLHNDCATLGSRPGHADYEAGLVDVYEGACGLRRTEAGLLRLDGA